jgi:hypothetical protein
MKLHIPGDNEHWSVTSEPRQPMQVPGIFLILPSSNDQSLRSSKRVSIFDSIAPPLDDVDFFFKKKDSLASASMDGYSLLFNC